MLRARRALQVALRVAAAVLVGCSPRLAQAHAIVVTAQPAMNAMVAQGNLDIRLDFNSRIDQRRSRLSLRRPDGSFAAVALAPDAPPNALIGRAQVTTGGRWSLDWQVLSVDGHITRGELIFFVADRAP